MAVLSKLLEDKLRPYTQVMSQKNETAILILSLVITVGLVGAGLWWFLQRSGTNSGGNAPSNQPTQTSRQSFAQLQDVPAGLFSYGGSTSWAPIRLTSRSSNSSGKT